MPESNPTEIASTPAAIAVIHAIRMIWRRVEGVNLISRISANPSRKHAYWRSASTHWRPAGLGRRLQGKKSVVACIKGPPGRRLQFLGVHRCLKRLALAASLAAPVLVAGVSPAGATVTTGSNLARVPNSAANYSPRPTFSNVSLASDRQAPGGLSSPVNGTVVRWRIRVGDSTRMTNFRIIRPLGGGMFTGAGTSAPVTPPIQATTSYDVQLPIQIGDYIGIDCCDPGVFEPDAEFFVTGGAAIRDEWQPTLADGAAGRTPVRTNAYEVAVNAEIDPTSTFSLDVAAHNKRKGTATISAHLPNPGELAGSGKGVRVANAAIVSRDVRAPGKVRLLIRAKGKKKQKLNSTGRVRVRPEITYTPTGGSPNTRSVKLKLIKR
jgi:hypothetical protein